MANAEQIVTNGNGNGVESDEEDLSKMRPVDIDQDVREMERRKRVILVNILFTFQKSGTFFVFNKGQKFINT